MNSETHILGFDVEKEDIRHLLHSNDAFCGSSGHQICLEKLRVIERSKIHLDLSMLGLMLKK